MEDGEIKLENAVVSDSSHVEAEQGTVLLYGEFTGTINAQCEEAHLNMEITGDQKDFNYSLTVQDAEIRIGDDNYHEPGSEKIDNGADDTMNLSCTQGDIDIDFIN